jgi:uncharacterized protein
VADLYSRIKHLKRRKSGSSATSKPTTPPSSFERTHAAVAGLGDWSQVAPLVWLRETCESLGPAGARIGPEFDSRLLGRRLRLDQMCFMDTETTGLSGGAGTTVFLVGAGVIVEGAIRVRQLLLADFPGEPEYLGWVAELLAPEVWVSYNGKAFDARLLESRFLMNGRRPLAAEQLDLLYWSRRLWRSRLGSCSLSDIERHVLGRGRADDVPGVEIPERYFRFLRDGDARALHDVFEHHRLDIVSLAHLFLRVESVLDRPLDDRTVDGFRLGRALLVAGDERAAELLERVARSPDPNAVPAARLLSRSLRRRGMSRRALDVLMRVAPAGSMEIAIEAAKILEHDLRDVAAARDVVEACLLESGQGEPGPDVQRRLDRLTRKLLRFR